MSGTLFGLALSQQHDSNGRPLSGAKLYIYEAGTTTPAGVFKDSGLTAGQEHPFPIETDANGRIPQFWLTDGTYRARLTNSAGVVQFDIDQVLAIGPSSGEGGGGGGVDATAIFQTGDPIWLPRSGTRAGWVRHNARTIGSASSGATERANADTAALYTYLWENYSNALCPVTGGRGASAAADFAANKPIATLDMRSRAAFGLADMGNSDSGGFTDVTFDVGNATTAASRAGSARVTLAIDQIPAHTHPAVVTDPGHVHDVKWNQANQFGSGGNAGPTSVSAAGNQTGTDAALSKVTGITVTVNENVGGGGGHNNMPPAVLGTWYVKL